MGKRKCLVAIVILFVQWSYAQKSIVGHVIDCSTAALIPHVNVFAPELGSGTISEQDGSFNLEISQSDSVLIQVSCIGYAPTSQWLHSNGIAVKICLEQSVHELNQISVIAEERSGLETASVIKRDAILHLQASSLADVLQLLPGGLSSKNDLTSMQLITMREAGAADKGAYNSSLGTAVIIDGAPLANDAQMQNILGSSGEVDLDISQRNTTGKGVDLRHITTDDIESVEVIRGIPSVKYGDLTSGVVVIKRSNKETPLQLRLKSSANAKQMSIGKGIKLSDKQVINANFAYVNHISDPRSVELSYSRYNSSLRYKRHHKGSIANSELHFSGDYTGSFDEQQVDPQKGNPVTDKYENTYHRMGITTKANWNFHALKAIKALEFRAGVNYTIDEKDIDRFVSGGRTLPTVLNTTEGVHDGFYLDPGYQSYLNIDDRPLYINANLESQHHFKVGKVKHELTLGFDYRYSKNRGEGQSFDPRTPPFHSKRTMPRTPKDIASIQQISSYIEDQVGVQLGQHTLTAMLGVRAAAMLNLSDNYDLSNQVFYDPRINLNWQLPQQRIGEHKLSISFHAGYGNLHKFPTLSHLYPERYYYDILQLNYYSQQEELSRLNFITYIQDPVNYNIKPSNNKKYEAGILLRLKNKTLSLTVFEERMESGFMPLKRYRLLDYTHYDASSLSSVGLTERPQLEDFTSEERVTTVLYHQYINGGLITKRGVEYRLDLGHVKGLSSRITIDGAWFNTTYDQSLPAYKSIDVVLDGKAYPYTPLYDWNNGRTYSSFNTNARFDTHIKPLKLMFSSLLQTVWFKSKQRNRHNGMPSHYIDNRGNTYQFKPDDINDPILRHMYDRPSDNEFDLDKEAIAVTLNLRVSKKINEQIGFSFYVNNILDYTPDYTRKDGYKVKRRVLPWFGMEMNINI